MLFRWIYRLVYLFLVFTFLSAVAAAEEANPDPNIGPQLLNAMKTYQVPVVGYAIIKDYQIIAADTVSIDPKISVSKKSIFQAASLSKTVSAYGTLKLVSAGQLTLDAPVNNLLKTWQIPTNSYNKNNPVTVRELLNMTSGLSVSGFEGYPQGQDLPTLENILDGKKPATNTPIRVLYEPGSQYFYSGGGFEVLQKMLEDLTQQGFATWIDKTVLSPLGMSQSIFQFPLNDKLHGFVVPGFSADGKMIGDGWQNYPTSAAGGLWSTPTDLALLAINMSKSIFEDDSALIDPTTAEQLFKRDKNTSYGLGVVVNGEGDKLNFRKAGHNTGYHSEMLMFPETGDGVVIMTDSENGESVINYIIPIIAARYNWPCYFPFFDERIEIPQATC